MVYPGTTYRGFISYNQHLPPNILIISFSFLVAELLIFSAKINRMEMQLLTRINQILMQELEPSRKIEQLCDTVRDGIQAERGSIFIASSGELFSIKQDGTEMISIPVYKGVVGSCYQSRKHVIINDAKNCSLVLSLTDYDINSLMAVPIVNINTNRICGVVEYFNRTGGFSENERRIASFTAAHFANYIETIASGLCA